MLGKIGRYSHRLNEHVANATTHLSNSLEDPRDGTGNPHATVSSLCAKDGGMWHKNNADSPGKTKGKPSPHFPQESRELEMTRWAFVYLNLNLIPLVTKKKHGDTS